MKTKIRAALLGVCVLATAAVAGCGLLEGLNNSSSSGGGTQVAGVQIFEGNYTEVTQGKIEEIAAKTSKQNMLEECLANNTGVEFYSKEYVLSYGTEYSRELTGHSFGDTAEANLLMDDEDFKGSALYFLKDGVMYAKEQTVTGDETTTKKVKVEGTISDLLEVCVEDLDELGSFSDMLGSFIEYEEYLETSGEYTNINFAYFLDETDATYTKVKFAWSFEELGGEHDKVTGAMISVFDKEYKVIGIYKDSQNEGFADRQSKFYLCPWSGEIKAPDDLDTYVGNKHFDSASSGSMESSSSSDSDYDSTPDSSWYASDSDSSAYGSDTEISGSDE